MINHFKKGNNISRVISRSLFSDYLTKTIVVRVVNMQLQKPSQIKKIFQQMTKMM